MASGNIREFPTLGSHWNGKWGVICQWEHQIMGPSGIPCTGITLEWEIKGYFQVQQTLSGDFCIPVNPKCLRTVPAWKGDICYNALLLKSQEFFLCLWNAAFQSCECRSRDPGGKWGTWSWEKHLDPCVLFPGLNPCFHSCPSRRFAFISPISF